MKINKNLKMAVLWLAAVVFFISCAPRSVLKTPSLVLEEKTIPITDDELNYWKSLASTSENSNKRAEGNFWMGQYYYNKKDFDNAEKYFSYDEKYYKDLNWGYLAIMRLADIYLDKNDRENMVKKFTELLEKKDSFPDYKNSVSGKLVEGFGAYKEDELKILYNKHINASVDEYALYELCKKELAVNNYDDFLRHAGFFLTQFKNSIFFGELTKSYSDTIKFRPVNNKKIGVIIPLSNQSMDMGTLVKDGLELALSEYNEGKQEQDKIKLFYIDEGDEEKFEASVINAIETESVIALVGPLYSKTVTKLLPIIERYNIALFSPTAASPDLTDKSEYFFRNCSTAEGQAYAIAKYMSSIENYKNIGVIYPDDTYGRIMEKFFAEKFKSNGGSIAREYDYESGISDFQNAICSLGGVNTILFKQKRADEQLYLGDRMDDAGKQILDKLYGFFNLTPIDEKAQPTPDQNKPMEKVKVSLLHFATRGDDVKKYNIDTDMTNKLSYAIAKDKQIGVIKQKNIDSVMQEIGVGYDDINRETALTIARQVKSDVVVWGKIVEEKSDTIYANFIPNKLTLDEKGNTKLSYSFSDDDYFVFDEDLFVMTPSDEQTINEISFVYKKVKEPKTNPLKLDAIYIPASDRTMVSIRPQLKFYDLDLPVFGSESLASNYVINYKEDVTGVIFPTIFFGDDKADTVQNFMKKYQEAYGVVPNIMSATSYDLMKIMCDILTNKDKKIDSREQFKNELLGVKDYMGITGKFSFYIRGAPLKEYYLLKIDESGFKPLGKIIGD